MQINNYFGRDLSVIEATPSVNGDSVQSKSTENDSFKTMMEEILEKGLLKYAEEKRIEELREKILKILGVSAEDLAKMTPEERAELEQRVTEEIQKRLAAESELERKNEYPSVHRNEQGAPDISSKGEGLKNVYPILEKIIEVHLLNDPENLNKDYKNSKNVEEINESERKV